MSTAHPDPSTAADSKKRRPWWRRKRVLIPAGLLFLFLIIPTPDTDEDEPAAQPTPTAVATTEASPEPTAEQTTPARPTATETRSARPTTPPPAEETTPEPTPEPTLEPAEDEFDAVAAREELLEDARIANGMRTIEEACTTDMIIEGTWFQCYFEDVEFTNPTTLKVILSTPGDVDDGLIGERARTWFVNMINPEDSDTYPELSTVYTSINGLDSASSGRW